MHTEILTEKQVELLKYIEKFHRKFYLVGGTAIAFHLGHRRSLDFDLFCQTGLIKHQIRNKLIQFPFKQKKLFEDTDQLHLLINDIKVTFFSFPYNIQHPLKVGKLISIPTLLTLASMKAFALGRRAKWKDYVDIYFILRDHFTIEEISSEAIKNFKQMYSEKLFREQLAFHKDIDYSEPVEYLVTIPSEEEIKQFLIDKALDFEIINAAKD
ncbi:MAG: nucleotidyl transferase AbiEii/AbiGii toxin family protein [Bacteroidia bacterium]|jgi:hypothetical protein|nr:nucleotidyl transferase AbiEii/AbiGii toxin family protein [Bacteroidia bacterium]